MSKLAYRVYWRDVESTDKKWVWCAAFVSKSDAIDYMRDKTNSCPPEENTLQWKMMQGSRNIHVIK